MKSITIFLYGKNSSTTLSRKFYIDENTTAKYFKVEIDEFFEEGKSIKGGYFYEVESESIFTEKEKAIFEELELDIDFQA